MQATQETGSRFPAPQFTPDVFAICRSGRPMPARRVRTEEDGRVTVASAAGREYTFDPAYIMPAAEARARLHQDRVAMVLSSYSFDVISETPRVIRCQSLQHPRPGTGSRSNYILVEGAGGWMCSCPAFAKSDFHHCKHCEAVLKMDGPAGSKPALPAPPVKAAPVAAEDW